MATLYYPVDVLSSIANFTCYIDGKEIISTESRPDRAVIVYGKVTRKSSKKPGPIWVLVTGQVELWHHSNIRRTDQQTKASGVVVVLENHIIKNLRFEIKQNDKHLTIEELKSYIKNLPPSYEDIIKRSLKRVDLNERLQSRLFI